MKFKLTSNVIAAAFPMLLSLSFAALAAALPECAFAAGTDKDFQSLYDMLKNWSQGTLGRSIALMFLLVGLGVGVVRGSIMGAVGCIAAAMALFIGPQIIDNIFTALI